MVLVRDTKEYGSGEWNWFITDILYKDFFFPHSMLSTFMYSYKTEREYIEFIG